MNSEGTNNAWLEEKWHIDLDWYRANEASFYIMTQDFLCPKCRKKIKKEAKAEDIIKAITGCCAKKDDFITSDMPVMSSIFRFFLSNGNEPVELGELSRELSERRGTIAGTSPEVLHRLLLNDRYYGIRPFNPVAEKV